MVIKQGSYQCEGSGGRGSCGEWWVGGVLEVWFPAEFALNDWWLLSLQDGDLVVSFFLLYSGQFVRRLIFRIKKKEKKRENLTKQSKGEEW